ncbi:potassium channel family protein [Fontimonas sp. SYSU GA230001]|uniref:potassium channel family protein n=1 Tax=Fontimonas sp. SYSU GA230001 TaxID=3142450 RepID=UPI0032B4331D
MANRIETLDLLSAIVSADHWLVVLITGVLAVTTMFMHYEALERMNHSISHWRLKQRTRVLELVVWIVALHIAEIWIFGVGLYAAVQFPDLGYIAGAEPLKLLDAIYMSAVTFTTVGYGDLAPKGPIRLILAVESLIGLVLITWSASFTYLEMQRYWRPR